MSEERLIVNLDAAVGDALNGNGLHINDRPHTHTAMRAALVAGLQVLAREFGPRPDDARRCVAENPSTGNRCTQPEGHSLVHQDANGDQWRDRELPTESGRVVLAAKVRGIRLTPARTLFSLAALDGGPPTWYSGEDIDGTDSHPARFVTDWVEAVVVPEDVVSLLRSITEAGRDRDIPDDEVRDLMVTDAVEALRLLGGTS